MTRRGIILVFLSIAALLGLVGFAGLQTTNAAVENFDIIADDLAPALLQLRSVQALGLEAIVEAQGLAFSSESIDEEHLEHFHEVTEQLQTTTTDYLALAEEEAELGEEGEEDFATDLQFAVNGILITSDLLVDAKQAGASTAELIPLSEQLTAAEDEFEELINEEIADDQARLLERDVIADAAVPRAQAFAVTTTVVAILMAAGLAFVLDRQASNQRMRQAQTEQHNQDLAAANLQLKVATRQAEEANRLKDLFLATMSHELRTPLNAIIGFLGLMLYSEQLDEENSHMATRSVANAERLLGLINNILDLSRIASGRLEIIPVEMSPYELAETIQDDMSFWIKERGIEFNVEVDPTLPQSIRNDQERLVQITTNLVNNAVKFTDEGSVSLSLRCSGDRMIIEVKDTGIGIALSKQQIIFDEFTQVDSSTKRKHGGAGLGLSIVKRLTVLMNGTVKVSSDAGKGSTFTVELPLNLTPAPESAGLVAVGVAS